MLSQLLAAAAAPSRAVCPGWLVWYAAAPPASVSWRDCRGVAGWAEAFFTTRERFITLAAAGEMLKDTYEVNERRALDACWTLTFR